MQIQLKFKIFFAFLYLFLTLFFAFIRIIVDGRIEFEDPNTNLEGFFKKYKNKIIFGQLLSFALFLVCITMEFTNTDALQLMYHDTIPKVILYPIIGFSCQFLINKYKNKIEQ